MRISLQIAFTAALPLLALVSAQAQNAPCDRACLEGLISNYLTALAAHDPGRLPVAPGVKYVENDQPLALGTGEWQVAGPAGKYRHVFADPQGGEVAAAITTILEHSTRVIYVVRLKMAHRKITEIETQITRDPVGAARYEKMGQPEAVWLQAVPPAQRISRARLIAQANKYYSGMERNNPAGDYSFFDKDCNRLEDALQTTNVKTGDAYGHSNDTAFASLGCQAQFQTGFLGFVTKIRERRFLVDEERQAVLAFTTFDHNGTVRTLPSVNGKSSPIPAYFDVPRTLHASEAFRLRGDKLFRIEMTLTEVPYGMSSPFHPGPPANLRGPGTDRTAPNPCDRACLENLVQQVLQAMLAHDGSRLPLAKDVRYSENGQFIAIGDGLWGTATQIAMPGASDYAAFYADPATDTGAYWGLTNEHGTPGVLALRVKVEGGKIREIEAIDVREESQGPRGGTMTLMRPPLPVELNIAMLGALDPSFLAKTSAGNPYTQSLGFRNDCKRRDNAVEEKSGCAMPIGERNARDRRILVSDSERGVAIVVAMIDDPGLAPAAATPSQLVPSTYMVPELVKVEGGAIARVEALVKWMPFGYTSAWPQPKQ
jgi:hypothetical protein